MEEEKKIEEEIRGLEVAGTIGEDELVEDVKLLEEQEDKQKENEEE